MTIVNLAIKNNKLSKLIKEIVFKIFKKQFQNNHSIHKEYLPDSKKIVRSNYKINDEFGYINKIEN
jgi:hypothetical protein